MKGARSWEPLSDSAPWPLVGFVARVALVAALGGCEATAESAAPNTPTFQSDTPAQASAAPGAAALCSHRVPADLCTRCNPDLIPVFEASGDWCGEHGVPESQCLTCNPKLTFPAPGAATPGKDWCKEHAVPESKCTKCHPELVSAFIEAGDFCRKHGVPESVCPYCHPEIVEAAGEALPVFPTPGTIVRLASPKTAAEAGLSTAAVEVRRLRRGLEVVGQLEFNQNRLAQLSSRAEALIREVRVDMGDSVRAGEALVVLASGVIGADQALLAASRARLDTARGAYAREEKLAATGISSKKDLAEALRELATAEAEHNSASAALDAAGAGPSSSGGRFFLAAPFAGTVVRRQAVAGRAVGPNDVLLEVADLSTMWASLDIPEADSLWVRPGQAVLLTFEGIRAAPIRTTITRVGARIDPATRTVEARVELPNPDGALKDGLFVRARIDLEADREALVVPREAVQTAQGHTVAFRVKGEGVYEPVAIEVIDAGADGFEVSRGLVAGDRLVVRGAFLLKTELLKESIGAGCCETDSEP